MRKALAGTAVLAACAVLAVPALAARRTIAVGDDFFVKDGRPPTVTVKAGTTVTWLWKGSSLHTVTVVRGPAKFRSPLQSSGRFSERLTRPGTYTIVCTIHQPDMRMTLKVTKGP